MDNFIRVVINIEKLDYNAILKEIEKIKIEKSKIGIGRKNFVLKVFSLLVKDDKKKESAILTLINSEKSREEICLLLNEKLRKRFVSKEDSAQVKVQDVRVNKIKSPDGGLQINVDVCGISHSFLKELLIEKLDYLKNEEVKKYVLLLGIDAMDVIVDIFVGFGIVETIIQNILSACNENLCSILNENIENEFKKLKFNISCKVKEIRCEFFRDGLKIVEISEGSWNESVYIEDRRIRI